MCRIRKNPASRHDGPVELTSWHREPGAGRYAKPEIERRFRVAGPVPVGGVSCEIEDRYLDGTRLRVRALRVGEESVFKLTQKVRIDPTDPAVLALTNTYLDAEEYAVLSALPAAVLRKTRALDAGSGFAVDRYAGALAGLVLAEIEVDDLAAPLDLPEWLGAEVTHDDRYSGGTLARLGSAGIAGLSGD
jgi:CYTH domain-containing protein